MEELLRHFSSIRMWYKSTDINVYSLSLWHSVNFLLHLGEVLSWNKSAKLICSEGGYVSLDPEILCLLHRCGLQMWLLLIPAAQGPAFYSALFFW